MANGMKGRQRRTRPRRGLLFTLLLALVAAPSAVDAASAAGRATAAQASPASGDLQVTALPASEGASIQELLGTASKGWTGNRASATIEVYSNHAKRMQICDNDSSDRYGLAILIDPSGTQAPIRYFDENPQDGFCFVHTIGYSVRKWKWLSVYQNGATYDDWDAWKIFPLPRADF